MTRRARPERLCRVHDADDPVVGRICGHGLPCPHHPRRASGPSGPSTPRDLRSRRGIEVSLSDAARARLDELAEAHGGNRSAAVEALIVGAPAPAVARGDDDALARRRG